MSWRLRSGCWHLDGFPQSGLQDRLRSSERLADHACDTAVFSSSPTTPGTLLFDYLTPTTYAPLHPLAFLSEFQVHRRIQGIIGILDASEYSDKTLADAVTAFHASLRDLPKTFATKVYGFDPGEKQLEEARAIQEGEGLVMVPAAGDVSFFLKTVLADFAGDILFEFSNMVHISLSNR